MSKSSDNFSKRPNSSRPLKVGEAIRHALSDIFLRGETHNPVLDTASITFSEVRVTPDLKNATVYFMPLAGSHQQVILDELVKVAPYLRSLIADKVELRYTPKLWFKLDTSFDEASKIDRLLKGTDVPKDPKA